MLVIISRPVERVSLGSICSLFYFCGISDWESDKWTASFFRIQSKWMITIHWNKIHIHLQIHQIYHLHLLKQMWPNGFSIKWWVTAGYDPLVLLVQRSRRRRKWRKTTHTNLIRPWLRHWPKYAVVPIAAIGLTGKWPDCINTLVFNNGAPICWACTFMSVYEVCKSNRGSTTYSMGKGGQIPAISSQTLSKFHAFFSFYILQFHTKYYNY